MVATCLCMTRRTSTFLSMNLAWRISTVLCTLWCSGICRCIATSTTVLTHRMAHLHLSLRHDWHVNHFIITPNQSNLLLRPLCCLHVWCLVLHRNRHVYHWIMTLNLSNLLLAVSISDTSDCSVVTPSAYDAASARPSVVLSKTDANLLCGSSTQLCNSCEHGRHWADS